MEKNNKSLYVSSCCNSFYIFSNGALACPVCGTPIENLNNNTISLTVNSKNQNTMPKNIPDSIIKRFATDPTFALTDNLCKKCKSKTRYIYNDGTSCVYVCSNKDCRKILKI